MREFDNLIDLDWLGQRSKELHWEVNLDALKELMSRRPQASFIGCAHNLAEVARVLPGLKIVIIPDHELFEAAGRLKADHMKVKRDLSNDELIKQVDSIVKQIHADVSIRNEWDPSTFTGQAWISDVPEYKSRFETIIPREKSEQLGLWRTLPKDQKDRIYAEMVKRKVN